MLGRRKQFDQRLHDWAKSAEFVCRQWLERIGYQSIHLPNGKYGPDVLSKSACGTEQFFVEVERRSFKTWKEGPFPYSEVNIPERRGSNEDVLLFIVRYDLDAALIVFPVDIKNAELVESQNRYVKEDEYFRKVDLCRCLFVEFGIDTEQKTIAERSRANILKWWVGDCGAVLMKERALGSVPPYGMTDDEWRSLLSGMRKDIESALFGDEFVPTQWKPVGPAEVFEVRKEQ